LEDILGVVGMWGRGPGGPGGERQEGPGMAPGLLGDIGGVGTWRASRWAPMGTLGVEENVGCGNVAQVIPGENIKEGTLGDIRWWGTSWGWWGYGPGGERQGGHPWRPLGGLEDILGMVGMW